MCCAVLQGHTEQLCGCAAALDDDGLLCCSVLVAVYCSVLQCVVVCCNLLQCVAVCYSVVRCVIVRCIGLPCAAVCCSVSQGNTAQGCVAL